MRSMLEKMEIYLDGKELELNRKKTKVMRFKKEEERIGKVNWRLKGREIEEMKEMKKNI